MREQEAHPVQITAKLSRREVLAGLGATSVVGAAPVAHAETEPFRIWHGKSLPELQTLFEDGARRGYRILSLSLYGAPDAPFFSGLMAKTEQPAPQRLSALLSAEDMHSEIDRQSKGGFGAALIAATGPASKPVFAAIFEPSEKKPLVRLGLRSGSDKESGTIQAMIHEAKTKGLILRCAAAYGASDGPHFAALWSPNVHNAAWDADGILDDEHLFAERLSAQMAGWARLAFVAPVAEGRLLSVYRDDQVGPWAVSHGLRAHQLEQEVAAQGIKGLQPVSLQAAGADAGRAKFAVVFASRAEPVPRVWKVTGPVVNARIDEAMKSIMTKAMIRQASLAIVQGTRLVYARGYTYCEPDWPLTEPTTTFRLASVSKTVAALAIYQLMEAGRVKLSDRMQDILALRTVTGAPPKDPRFSKVTVEHLLNHTSGIPAHSSSVAIRDAHAAARPDRTWHFPVTAEMARSYLASLDLSADPGARTEYNNCAYFLLGQIIAKLYGTETALDALQSHLLTPLDIKRIRRARSLIGDQPPDEARYRVSYGPDQVRVLSVGHSVMSDTRPLVPIGYGLEHLEIHEGDAGLSAAMTDIGRLIAILIGRKDNGAMRGETIRAMISNAAARGGHGFDVVKDRGGGAFYGHKRGSFAASGNVLQFNGDLGYAVVWSGGLPDPKVNWYPDLPPVMSIARQVAWGEDLFPAFGMASFST